MILNEYSFTYFFIISYFNKIIKRKVYIFTLSLSDILY